MDGLKGIIEFLTSPAALIAGGYIVLAIVVFAETGLLVGFFLPGDSLLVTAALLASQGLPLNIVTLGLLLNVAAIAGDNTNYWIGRSVGPRAFSGSIRFLKRDHLIRTQEFYLRHGGKTVFLARFVPIIRTFAPFVAGVGTMPYARFLAYSVSGGICWVGSCTGAGYAFGNIPVVRDNFSLVVLGIVVVSLLPVVITYFRERKRRVEG